MTSPAAVIGTCRNPACRKEIRLAISEFDKAWIWIHILSGKAMCDDGRGYAEPA